MLKVLTWNIDGLCDLHRKIRTETAVDLISKSKPNVICLQEVIDETKIIIDRKLLQFGYQLATVPGPSSLYYTLIYVDNNVSIVSSTRLSYIGNATSVMGRDIGLLQLQIGGYEILLLNSHLERYFIVLFVNDSDFNTIY